MSKPPLQNVVRTLFKLAGRPDATAGDQELLTRYVVHHDEAAFEQLVRRHGPMVHDLCRRLLGQEADADDATQAVFLVLVRKARSIRKQQSLASWLYGVAYRVAERAKRDAAATRKHERRHLPQAPAADPGSEVAWRDLCATLDAEMATLSDTYRAPLVLCYLEGQTRDRAARQLGLAVRTLDRRLERGRELLRARLARRGVTLSAALLVGGLSQQATAAGVASKLLSIANAATKSGAAAAAIPLRVQVLANGVLKSMAVAKLQTVAALVLGFGMAIAGTGALALRAQDRTDASAGQNSKPAAAPMPKAEPKSVKVEPPRTDRFGDPLPPGAVNRLGSGRFRHGGYVAAMAYIPDGSALAAYSRDGFLRLWDAKTGRLRWRLAVDTHGHEWALSVSRAGKNLAVMSDSEYMLVETDTGKSLTRHSWPKGLNDDAVRCVAITPDLRTLARGFWDASVRLYDATNGNEKLRIAVGDKVKLQIPLDVNFSSDGKSFTVAVYGPLGVTTYDSSSGKAVQTLRIEQGSAHRLAFSQDRRLLAALCGESRQIVIWDVKSGKQKYVIDKFPGLMCAEFSPDGAVLAIGSQGKDIVLYDTNSGKELRRLHWHPSDMALAFSPDGKTLASGDGDGCIAFWEVATGKLLPPSPEPSGSMYNLEFVAGGKQLLSFSDSIDWWDTRTGEVVRHMPRDPDWNWGMAVSPDGKLLATWVPKVGIALIDIQTRRRVRTLGENKKRAFSTGFSPDGVKLFSVGGFDPRVIIWDVATGKPLHVLQSHLAFANHLVVSPDGRWLASAGSEANAQGDYDIRLWEVATGRLVHRLPPRRGSAMAMAFSADSSQLVSAGGEPGRPNDSGEVQLWDLATGKEVRSFPGHKERVACVAISPDGRTLASGSGDKTLRLWEVASGLERHRISGHEGYVHSVAFSPDGKLLAAASGDAPVYIWDVYGSETSRSAAGKLGKEKSDKLWQQLAATDAAHGFQATCTLIAHPDEAVPLLATGWQKSPRASRKQIEGWLHDLDSAEFAVRQKATADLAKFIAGYEDLLRQARDKTESLETRRRLDQLLNRVAPERLRRLRIVEALERIDTSAARQLLQDLASQTEDAILARDAKASLKRLTQR